MGDKQSKPQTVNIDGTEYSIDDMTPEQIALLNHVIDLDRKVGSAQFNLVQLQIGKETFLKMLKEELDKKKDGVQDVVSE